MKDTILTARRKKTELITLFLCFIIANLVNLYSIFTYNTPLTEMITHFLCAHISVALYIIWSLLRILFYGITALFKKKKE
ncbi:hypothetical protein [Bacteroides thetaiotaomicron]|uniref:hypothetical protein n=1 Tax=Bacteroides thetaiotaomicron TaxID=818 RepID=UPI001F5BDBE6|nr:hypothetical protein [Bacteroides thetaiotaomicron]